MGIGHSIVIQADNSTFPTSDECAVFRIIFGDLADDWLSAESRSLVFLNQEIGSVRIDVQRLALLIYYSILFEWHVHIVCIHENRVLRIGLEDGVVCVRARGRLDKSVEALVQGILDDPLRL